MWLSNYKLAKPPGPFPCISVLVAGVQSLEDLLFKDSRWDLSKHNSRASQWRRNEPKLWRESPSTALRKPSGISPTYSFNLSPGFCEHVSLWEIFAVLIRVKSFSQVLRKHWIWWNCHYFHGVVGGWEWGWGSNQDELGFSSAAFQERGSDPLLNQRTFPCSGNSFPLLLFDETKVSLPARFLVHSRCQINARYFLSLLVPVSPRCHNNIFAIPPTDWL